MFISTGDEWATPWEVPLTPALPPEPLHRANDEGGRHLHSRFRRSQWEHRGRCSSHLTFLRLRTNQICGSLGGLGMLERNGMRYLHVMQPFLDRVGLLGGVPPSRRLLWVAVGLSPFMLCIRTMEVSEIFVRA